MKRTRIRPRSDKRHAENVVRREVMMRVRARDVDCQAKGILPDRCFGPLNGHELRKAGQGGSRTDEDNILLLCDFHNGWIEDSPISAWWEGFVIRTVPPAGMEDHVPPDRRPSQRNI
jgi:hypothetical protein